MDDTDTTIEDIVGDIRCSDSQRSCVTSLHYSTEFISSHTPSSKDTYVIDPDINCSEDSLNFRETVDYNTGDMSPYVLKGAKCNLPATGFDNNLRYQVVAQETCTQTSKTIIELAEFDEKVLKIAETKNLETQTSLISISKNKTIQYKIEVNNEDNFKEILDSNRIRVKSGYAILGDQHTVKPSKVDDSLKLQMSEFDADDFSHEVHSMHNNSVFSILESGDIKETWKENKEVKNILSEFESSFDSDIEEDSLMGKDRVSRENSPLKLFDYAAEINVTETFATSTKESMRPCHNDVNDKVIFNFNCKNNMKNIPPSPNFSDDNSIEDSEKLIYCKSTTMNLRTETMPRKRNSEPFKLPPIKNQSCPNSPQLNSLFTVNIPNNVYKPNTVNNLHETSRETLKLDRREFDYKNLASGEGAQISDRTDKPKIGSQLQLPPIHTEGGTVNAKTFVVSAPLKLKLDKERPEAINIKEKIRKLKSSNYPMKILSEITESSHAPVAAPERSSSPSKSFVSHTSDDSKIMEVSERACEILCLEFIKRLNSPSWIDVMETLEDMPRMLGKFWNVITEQRIADLLRLICQHADSPRSQVARTSCKTIATILKVTNYTKKPDFYECVSLLLTKTGSYSRPLRRAANLALDEIVSSVDLSHSVTALCLHGAGHKSSLVRCATARLLVVCCALGRGGRELLRARPVSTVTARKFAMRALSLLLEDRNSDARKYAERLYSMLRPLPNFEAFFLTDLDMDTATQQIKRYDKLLLCGPSKEIR